MDEDSNDTEKKHSISSKWRSVKIVNTFNKVLHPFWRRLLFFFVFKEGLKYLIVGAVVLLISMITYVVMKYGHYVGNILGNDKQFNQDIYCYHIVGKKNENFERTTCIGKHLKSGHFEDREIEVKISEVDDGEFKQKVTDIKKDIYHSIDNFSEFFKLRRHAGSPFVYENVNCNMTNKHFIGGFKGFMKIVLKRHPNIEKILYTCI